VERFDVWSKILHYDPQENGERVKLGGQVREWACCPGTAEFSHRSIMRKRCRGNRCPGY